MNQNGKLTFVEYCNAITPLSPEYAQLITGRPEFYSLKSLDPAEYFNVDTRNELRNFWKVVLQNERASECIRARIAKRPHFNLKQAFSYCDKDSDGVVTPKDIRDMLSENGYFATEKELHLIMHKFDKDRDGKICLSEYADELLPKLGVI